MRVLFDQGTPLPLRTHLTTHDVESAFDRGWSRLSNGELIREAENAGFDVMVTTDQNLKYQQDLETRKIGIVVLLSTSWPRIQRILPQINEALDKMGVGGYVEVEVP